jgi:superfamily I DNA/RNA helicase
MFVQTIQSVIWVQTLVFEPLPTQTNSTRILQLVVCQNLVTIDRLIVDEYQDLNPLDLEFVDAIIEGGATTFVAGDDDQSIYSFRFALSQGIQAFPAT